jgi:hypothetical protein
VRGDERRAAVAELEDTPVRPGRVRARGGLPAVLEQLRDPISPQPDQAIDLGVTLPGFMNATI